MGKRSGGEIPRSVGVAVDAALELLHRGHGAIAVVGDPRWRGEVADAIRRLDEAPRRTVTVAAPSVVPAPWRGTAMLLEALRPAAPALSISHLASLEAAAGGHVVGDHLGLGVDLRGLLVAAGQGEPFLLVAEDVHRFDLGTAAALSYACSNLSGSHTSVVITQTRTARGVTGLPATVQPVEEALDDREPPPALPGDAMSRAAQARRARSALDAADSLARAGDPIGAARQWLEGGRADLARQAVNGSDDPVAWELRARLAFATESTRAALAAVAEAVERLEPVDRLAVARLHLLPLVLLISQGRIEEATRAVDAAREALDAAAVLGTSRPARRTVDEHIDLATTMLALLGGRGGDPEAVVGRADRVLAPVAEAGVDNGAINVVSAACMTLVFGQHHQHARRLIDHVVHALEARRALIPLALPLGLSTWLARREVQLGRALADGTAALDIARAAGATNTARFVLTEICHIESIQGRIEDCRRHVAELLPADGVPLGTLQASTLTALANAELADDNPRATIDLLERLRHGPANEIPPSQVAWRRILVVAYVLEGRRSDAEAVLADLEGWTVRDPSPRLLGAIEAVRGELAGTDQYDVHFQRALELLTGFPAGHWGVRFSYVRRLLGDGRRAEAESLSTRMLAEARLVGAAGFLGSLLRLLGRHGITPDDSSIPAEASLPPDLVRVAVLLADGADEEEVATRLRMPAAVASLAVSRVHAAAAGRQHPAGRRTSGGGASTSTTTSAPPAAGGGDDQNRDEDQTEDRAEESGPTAAVEIRLLGPTRVVRQGTSVTVPHGLPATLLAYVAVAGPVHVEAVLDLLWPDVDLDTARSRLRQVLSRLRTAVGRVVVREGELLALTPGSTVDVRAFERCADEATRAGDDRFEPLARRALSLWTGDPLLAWPYDDWAIRRRERLVRTRSDLLHRLAAARWSAGDAAGALAHYDDLLAADPFDELAWERAIDTAHQAGLTRIARQLADRRTAELAS